MKLLRSNSGLFPDFVNFFDNGWEENITKPVFKNTPAVNVKESEKNFEIELAAPGLKREDFKIELNKNVLTLSASNEKSFEETNKDYTRREFYYENFSRSFVLPENKVEANNIVARYNDGILHIEIPKRAEAIPTTKMIEIQ